MVLFAFRITVRSLQKFADQNQTCAFFTLLKVTIKATVKKASFTGQLPVTSVAFKGRNRSVSTFSTASSASACYAFHHLNPDNEIGGDGSDLPMVCQASISQPCSHHPSFSGPSGSRYCTPSVRAPSPLVRPPNITNPFYKNNVVDKFLN